MPENTPDNAQDILVHLNQETARIPWSELQRFFASGHAICVDSSLDLISVAAEIHNDAAEKVDALIQQGLVGPVSDQQALDWFEKEAEVWALVIRPWVLVQDI